MHSNTQLIALAAVTLLMAGCGDSESTGFEYRGSDLCVGAADQALLDMEIAGSVGPDAGLPHPNETVRDCVFDSCSSELFSGMGLDTCVENCLDMTSLGALTSECTGCFIDVVLCGQESCVSECLSSAGTACADCMTVHCFPGQVECAGHDLGLEP